MACNILLPCPCGQKGRSILTGRFPVDASTVRLFSFISGFRATMVPGMRCHVSHTSRIVRSTSQRCLLSEQHSVDGRSRSAPSSTGFHGCLSVRLCRTPTGPPQYCSSCPSSLVAPVAQRKPDVLRSSHGDQHQKFPRQGVEESRASHVHHVMCEAFPLFDRPQCSMPLSLPGDWSH